MRSGRQLGPGAGDLLVILAAASCVWFLCAALDTRAVLDTDAVNLALAIDRFDLAQHQPHPPGYLGYVVLLRAVHAVAGLDPLATVKLLARALAVATLAMTYLAARAIAPGARSAARWAVAVAATSPLLLYYTVDAQTHLAEGAIAAALVWLLAAQRRDRAAARWRTLVGLGLLLAIGGSFRPSFALIAIGPVLWCTWRRWRELALVAAVAAAGTAAWVVPTVVSVGGWSAYRATSDALIGMFARSTSLASATSDSRMVVDNVLAVALWGGLALAPPAIAFALGARDAASRTAAAFVALMAAPAVAFYAAVFIAEAGYVMGLVPAGAVAAGVALGRGGRARAVVAGAVAAMQLAVFLLSPTTADASAVWVPSVAEIVYRQQAAEVFVDRVSAGARADDHVLVVADLGPTPLFRQLPLLRPNTDVLLINSDQLVVFEHTTLSLATRDGWRAAPGPALLVDGPPSVMTTTHDYDQIVVGPTYSDRLQRDLQAQTRCPIPPPSPELRAAHLPVARCFPSRRLRVPPHELEWRAASDDVRPLPSPAIVP